MIIRAVDGGPRTVDELVTLTGVSAITVRRDLTELSGQGVLRRVRGGAAPVPSRGARYPFPVRQAEHAATKQALAQAVALLVTTGDSVLVDDGTTALAVARELAGTGVTALALSLHAAAALAACPGNRVIVPGGPVSDVDLSFRSSGAEQAVRDMRVDYAFLSTCAAHPDSGLTVADWEDARIKRAAIASARRVVLVVTADKFSRTAAHRVAGLDDLDILVTTDTAPVEILAEAQVRGVRVITVEDPGDGV